MKRGFKLRAGLMDIGSARHVKECHFFMKRGFTMRLMTRRALSISPCLARAGPREVLSGASFPEVRALRRRPRLRLWWRLRLGPGAGSRHGLHRRVGRVPVLARRLHPVLARRALALRRRLCARLVRVLPRVPRTRGLHLSIFWLMVSTLL